MNYIYVTIKTIFIVQTQLNALLNIYTLFHTDHLTSNAISISSLQFYYYYYYYY